MKLLVTDYDGTMYYEKQDLKTLRENIEALKQFIKHNMVVIATGRPYTSIKKEIDTFSIPYNYIISSNGACIFNQNNSPIYTQTIKEEVIKKTLEYLQKLPYISKIKLIDIYGNETNKLENVIQIYIEIKIANIFELKRIKQELEFLDNNQFFNMCYFFNQTDKTDGIKRIQEIHGIENKDIYTIGNDTNDLLMLKEYNGYRVPYSYPRILLERLPKTSVKKLVQKIEGEL